MKRDRRQPIPKTVETEVLTKSLRRCCVCYGLDGDISQKDGQIAHLDQDRSNHRPDNLAWLCFDHHNSYDSQSRQGKGFTEREVKSYREKLWEAIAQNKHLRQYPRPKTELENRSVRLEVTASLSLESTDTRHGLLTIKALNSGTKVARIRRVAVLLAPLGQTMGGRTLTPDSSELNIGQKQAVVQIEGDDDMHEWQQVLNFKPHFEVHERAGERYGKGYVELTSGEKLEFEFQLLPDSAWSLLTAPIAPVFGNKAGHRCSRCGFVFLKQAEATTVTCPRCKQVDDLKPKR
jgi:hypothetical protein